MGFIDAIYPIGGVGVVLQLTFPPKAWFPERSREYMGLSFYTKTSQGGKTPSGKSYTYGYKGALYYIYPDGTYKQRGATSWFSPDEIKEEISSEGGLFSGIGSLPDTLGVYYGYIQMYDPFTKKEQAAKTIGSFVQKNVSLNAFMQKSLIESGWAIKGKAAETTKALEEGQKNALEIASGSGWSGVYKGAKKDIEDIGDKIPKYLKTALIIGGVTVGGLILLNISTYFRRK